MPINLSYSQMTIDDVEEVFSIQNDAYQVSIDEAPSITHLKCIVCACPDLTLIARDENGTIVGGMVGSTTKGRPCNENWNILNHPEADHIVIHTLFVNLEFQKCGIGSQIAKYYYNEWILNHKNGTHRTIKFIYVHTLDRYYKWMESLGFRVVGLSQDMKLPNGEPYVEFIMNVEDRMK